MHSPTFDSVPIVPVKVHVFGTAQMRELAYRVARNFCVDCRSGGQVDWLCY